MSLEYFHDTFPTCYIKQFTVLCVNSTNIYHKLTTYISTILQQVFVWCCNKSFHHYLLMLTADKVVMTIQQVSMMLQKKVWLMVYNSLYDVKSLWRTCGGRHGCGGNSTSVWLWVLSDAVKWRLQLTDTTQSEAVIHSVNLIYMSSEIC